MPSINQFIRQQRAKCGHSRGTCKVGALRLQQWTMQEWTMTDDIAEGGQ